MGKGAAPQPPSAQSLSKQQTKANLKTAQAQATLNAVNQITPFGELKYTQGPKKNGVRQWTATQTLSDPVKSLIDKQLSQSNQLGEIADGTIGQISDALSSPIDFGGEFTGPEFDTNTVESRLIELGRTRLDPMLEERRASLEQSLADRGVRMGSDAYDRAREVGLQGENDALNSLILNGRGQALSEQSQAFNQALQTRGQNISEALLSRQLPLQEYAALTGRSAPTPSYAQTPQTAVANTDVAGIGLSTFANQNAQYQQQQQNWNNMLGGLFGAGASLAML